MTNQRFLTRTHHSEELMNIEEEMAGKFERTTKENNNNINDIG